MVKRLHDIFVGAGTDGFPNMSDVVLGSAENHLGLVAAFAHAQLRDELDACHDRHVPVQQNHIGHRFGAAIEPFLSVLRFLDLEPKRFENVSRYLADYARVIDDKAGFHFK